MIVTSSFSGTYFSSSIPDVVLTTTESRVRATILVDSNTIYDEYLYPVSGLITIADLTSLLTPYAKAALTVDVEINLVEQSVTDNTETDISTVSLTGTVVYSSADVDTTASDFCSKHFLSILLGTKITSIGRLEYLHFLGTDSATVTAIYSDGSQQSFDATIIAGNSKYTTIDLSPDRFNIADKTLVAYTVTAGSRSQYYEIDFTCPDCAPILLFTNSFGVQELAYCTGTHKVAPEYKRNSALISGKLRNYSIEETRTFKANTGIMNFDMANWFDDVFRSNEIYIVNIIDGTPTVGREVTVTDSKSEYGNDDDEQPRFTFSYRYAQLNQNVLQLNRSGRIFDNTFDNTFN